MTDTTPRRTTRQREAVREALAASEEFVSAQALHQTLLADGAKVGLATVYRALAALAEDGEADALQSGGEVLYRACTPTHHHHLICRRCGRTVELEAAAVERWARQVAAEHGFVEPDHVVDIFGLCAECAAVR
ncbi:Fur family transcriptional regulator [Agrococcus carbonis]|uniref:Zinc uptake regulator, Fur family n=1 Tax=Agrococcus carbonis TaxID=684552 RepID=A0A1H1PKC1_9MICO|nr:transcriptional repressor [Agrococcus carbonis]SDS11583.1 zinc uptake regulator, Fur family [Agrococcus carbonis]